MDTDRIPGVDGGPSYVWVGRLVWGRTPYVDRRGDDVIVWACRSCAALTADHPAHTRWHLEGK